MRRPWLKKLALPAGATVAALLLGEVGLRLYGIRPTTAEVAAHLVEMLGTRR